MEKFILVRETWSHMAEVSGFDPLFALLAERKEIVSESFFVNQFQNVPAIPRWKRLLKHNVSININNACSPFVEQKHERLAREVVAKLKSNPNALVLLSVCENQLAPSFTNLSDTMLKQLVLFVHQPPAWFRLHWKDFSVFSKVKAVVCLCYAQAQFFEHAGAKQIVQIRHGVNLDFFFPKKLEAPPVKKLLFVGQWLRDMKTLSKAFYLIEQQMPNIELHCVVPQRNRNNNEFLYRLAQSNKVFWYDKISQEQLRDLYQSSHCLMLPLIDATANNALNEALACGMPIVTTHIGGTPDYVFTPGCTLAKPQNAVDLSNQCLVILNNLPEFQSKQQAIRIHAESNLNWHSQVETLLKFLLP